MGNDFSIDNIIIAEPDEKVSACGGFSFADIDAWQYGSPY